MPGIVWVSHMDPFDHNVPKKRALSSVPTAHRRGGARPECLIWLQCSHSSFTSCCHPNVQKDVTICLSNRELSHPPFAHRGMAKNKHKQPLSRAIWPGDTNYAPSKYSVFCFKKKKNPNNGMQQNLATTKRLCLHFCHQLVKSLQ